jgi:hypothetical protein
MSSATSTDKVFSAGAGRSARAGVDDGFRVSHFFVLLSLVAATVAVFLARPAAPENLVLISLTIGATGVASIAFYRTIAPLLWAPSDEDREPMSARLRADLEREKALTLRSIKELEFDKAMGKLSQQDFDQMAARLRARAVGIMKQLDAGASIYRQEVERELAARIGNTPDLKVRPAADRAPRRSPGLPAPAEVSPRAQVSNRTCACGTANDGDAKFCKTCGTKLSGAVA